MRGWVINLRRLVSLVDHLECHDIKADKILEYSSALDAVIKFNFLNRHLMILIQHVATWPKKIG